MALSGRISYRLYHYLWQGLDLLFPPHCAGCGSPNTRWCVDCSRSSIRIIRPYCQVCGRPGEFHPLCPLCQDHAPHYDELRSWSVYGGSIRNSIHHLKYARDIALGESLSTHLVQLYLRQRWQVDFITPVPLSIDRNRMRGYNQASLLARPMAYRLQLDYSDQLIYRERDTRSQVGLSASERRQNVWGAFRADGFRVAGKRILVVDDVTTTGSTLDACGMALKQAGAQSVYCLTLARSG